MLLNISRTSNTTGQLVLIGLSVWLHAADTLVTATLAPAIVGELGGVAYISWLITLYEVGAVIAGAATAAASQRMGLQRVLMIAALIYGVGCVLAAVAGSIFALLAGRMLQGLGGGALLSLSYIATYEWFEEKWWGKIFGIVALIWGAGSLLGPLIGGVFADHHAWRMAFWLFALLSAVLGVLTIALAPRTSTRVGPFAGWPVSTLTALSAGTLLIAQAGVSGNAVVSLAGCAVGGLLLYVSARLDRSAQVHLLPEQLLEIHEPLGAGLAMIFTLSTATTAFWAYGPLLLKVLFGFDPLVCGYLLAIEAIAWSLGTMAVTARASGNSAALIRIGIICVASGAAGFAIAVPVGSLPALVACAIGQGVGFGISWPAIVNRCVQLAGADKSLASAAPATLQRIGYAVGTAFAGVLANLAGLSDRMQISAARSAGFWVFAGFIPVLIIGVQRGWRFTQEK
jgi:MFS family permease